jgi:hypothetical protein
VRNEVGFCALKVDELHVSGLEACQLRGRRVSDKPQDEREARAPGPRGLHWGCEILQRPKRHEGIDVARASTPSIQAGGGSYRVCIAASNGALCSALVKPGA